MLGRRFPPRWLRQSSVPRGRTMLSDMGFLRFVVIGWLVLAAPGAPAWPIAYDGGTARPPARLSLAGTPTRDAHGATAPAASRADAAAWAWPTLSRVVARPFLAPADDYAPGHRGVDVATALGSTASAPADGQVAFAGAVGGRGVV